jgi:hypothetical protein
VQVEADVAEIVDDHVPVIQLTQVTMLDLPEPLDHVPALQLKHAALEVEKEAVEYVPALQLVQLVALAGDQVPALQVKQTLADVAAAEVDQVPALQLLHGVFPVDDHDPPVQGTGIRQTPPTSTYPLLQLAQLVDGLALHEAQFVTVVAGT